MYASGLRPLWLLLQFSTCSHVIFFRDIFNHEWLTLQMTAMRDVSATETAIIYALEPVWGGGFAWFLLGERWGTAGWIGAALVLGK